MATTPIKQRGLWKPNGVNQVALVDPVECCNPYNVCQDTLTQADSTVFQGATLTLPNGTVVTEMFPTTAVGATNLEAALYNVLKKYENRVWVKVVDTGANLTITHHGQVRLTNLIVGGSGVATTLLCTTQVYCDYGCNVAGTISGLEVNGTVIAFGSAITYGTSTPAQFKTAIETALTTAALAGTETVTVTNDADNEVFVVNIRARQGHRFEFGATVLTVSNCQEVFE